jgi:SpoVK/Ycf46/Vps4 family AAA+-type ATPase
VSLRLVLDEFEPVGLYDWKCRQTRFDNGYKRVEDSRWSNSEKKIARAVFERAVKSELAELIEDFKRRAATVNSPDQMWDIGESLEQIRQEFDRKYDYRYSQLFLVFGRLLREKRIREEDLQGLAADKLEQIRQIATYY